MDSFSDPQPSMSASPSMPGHLTRSLPSSHSVASTVSPGTSTPNSWAANGWLRGTPDTSPSSSGLGSPELKAKELPEDGSVSPTEGSIETSSIPKVKNICFTVVNVVDLNEQRIAAWNSAHIPIHEDGLLKVVRVARDGTLDTTVSLPGIADPVELKARQPNLIFSTRVVEATAEADIIFICVNTPTKTQGLGAGSMADVSAVENAARTVAKHAKSSAIIVEKSTVPCGTARMIQEILRHYRPDTNFEILSNPEFLAEGTAVENLMHPDRILIGSAQSLAGLQAAAVLKGVYAAWVPPARIVTVNTFSSELAKLVANTMLAQRISSINAVSAMCEEIGLGADVDDVSLAIGKDARLGPKFLQAGVGFGGSCFEKDILNLAYLARELHLDVVADYWLAILRINEDQRQRFARNIVRELNGSLRGKKIAVLGFAFKDGTNDTRNSIAVHIIKDLASEMPQEIAVFDPGCAPSDILDEVHRIGLSPAEMGRLKICSNWRDCVQEASAVCILTQWKQFRGRRLGSSAETSRKTSKPGGHGFSIDIQGECLNEVAIMDLESRLRQHASVTSDDPLRRLKPLPPCHEGCSQCGLDHRGLQSQEAVDWVEVAGMMEEPRWVFDGRNVVDRVELQRLGFRVRPIGKGYQPR
ncbi:UDP-glucose/GDP-mannose dehydrogenase family, NAD binding domain-containing protein [Achaetomium macrosporum]|uniref:UDP-glucose 6-dehydrogenase n=1 Tax=Achaetomium macrosporum TaxID=79813 RepID=A0AAN7CAV6_9PEZI|nr:UDP-glucose/GDP-mannose dehydrogenase family, NAD binding domain-containing protein [Achaetomium macrosporum]